MVEPIMFVGIGFLVASLLVIGVIPLMVHQRAVRLTMKRLEAVTPMSMAEIQADKDQLRAEFAMSTRRLEMSVDQMKSKTTSQLAEIGKKSEAIGRLKLELGDKTAALFAAEAQEKQLAYDLAAIEEELAAKNCPAGGDRAAACRDRRRSRQGLRRRHSSSGRSGRELLSLGFASPGAFNHQAANDHEIVGEHRGANKQCEALGAFGTAALHAAAAHQHRDAPLDAGAKALALLERWRSFETFGVAASCCRRAVECTPS